jgi:hypothetical protein
MPDSRGLQGSQVKEKHKNLTTVENKISFMALCDI